MIQVCRRLVVLARCRIPIGVCRFSHPRIGMTRIKHKVPGSEGGKKYPVGRRPSPRIGSALSDACRFELSEISPAILYRGREGGPG